MTEQIETFQISLQAAEAYEDQFVPAIFGEWAPRLIEAAGISDGHAVADIACGTGVVARAAAEVVGAEGRVVGVDLNEAMLAVARRLRPDLEWRHGDAAALPLRDGEFDAALCQAALMFVPDRSAAAAELARVVRPGGIVAIQVWAGVEEQPAYGTFVEIVGRRAGREAADLVSAYWALGDTRIVRGLMESSGVAGVRVSTHTGHVRFQSLDELITAEIQATPLAERMSESEEAAIRCDCATELAGFVGSDGRVTAPIAGHIFVGRTQGAS